MQQQRTGPGRHGVRFLACQLSATGFCCKLRFLGIEIESTRLRASGHPNASAGRTKKRPDLSTARRPTVPSWTRAQLPQYRTCGNHLRQHDNLTAARPAPQYLPCLISPMVHHALASARLKCLDPMSVMLPESFGTSQRPASGSQLAHLQGDYRPTFNIQQPRPRVQHSCRPDASSN